MFRENTKETGYTGLNKMSLIGGLLMLAGLASMPSSPPVQTVEPQVVLTKPQVVLTMPAAAVHLSSKRSIARFPRQRFTSRVSPAMASRTNSHTVLASAETMASRTNSHTVLASAERKFFVGGNWKCNGCEKELSELVEVMNKAEVGGTADVAICPPSVYLQSVRGLLRKDFNVCSQDVSLNGKGAFTGDIAADMLVDLGISHTLVGHSERRTIHKETSEEVALKAKKALASDIKVIACIGETLEEREADQTMDVLYEQLTPFKEMYTTADWDSTVIAYEPVWAIGTGKTATSAQAQEVHEGVRKWLSENVSPEVANKVRIIYGGSVNAGNAEEIGSMPDIDGFLVGGASLQPAFVDIINAEPQPEK